MHVKLYPNLCALRYAHFDHFRAALIGPSDRSSGNHLASTSTNLLYEIPAK